MFIFSSVKLCIKTDTLTLPVWRFNIVDLFLILCHNFRKSLWLTIICAKRDVDFDYWY